MANSFAQQADLVVTDARIYTVAEGRPTASAIAVKGGRILAVGDDVSGFIGRGTRRIDARGAMIMPGFIDSHAHMSALGDLLETLDLRGVSSIAEIARRVRGAAFSPRRASARPQPPRTEWIRGHNWDQTNWGGRFPTAADLDAAAPDTPVFLTRVDGHASWVNHKALEIAGVNASTPDPAGGKIVRDGNGQPTGILIDKAQDLVASKIPPPGREELKRRIAAAANECARVGLTTVHDAGIGPEELEAYRQLVAEKRLPVRVYAMIRGAGALWHEFLNRGPEISGKLTVRSIKLMADGAMGSRGAAFLKPYSDDPGNSGLLMLSAEEIAAVAKDAAKGGFQVNTHAIGDRANRTVLEAYGKVLGGHNDRRFRIEHAQVVAPEDFDLFAKYSVIASMQPTHATSDRRWVADRIGPEREKGAYAWRQFLSRGIRIPAGSDFPVEEPNPIYGFYAAVTRQDRNAKPEGGWMPDERMTREEALKSWTLWGAYAAFEEKDKGSLEPGKLADFVMLSKDIMRVPPPEILRTRVLMTVVGGEIVYSAAQ